MSDQRIDLGGTTVRYRDTGDGPTIVFVHGVYVTGGLWHGLADRLAGYRCVVPTWPLGAHEDPATDADLSARAVAAMIPALLEALDLRDVTLVGNDTGGGLCLAALATGHAGLARIGRLVLTNCDSYEHFPPGPFAKIAAISRRFPPFGKAFLAFLASKPGRGFFMKSVTVNRPASDVADRVFGAFATSKAARADALRTTQSLEPSITLDAVDALRAFDRPVLLAWGDTDKLFPMSHAERLAADFPDARLHPISGAATFVMLDQPDALAKAIDDFVTSTSQPA